MKMILLPLPVILFVVVTGAAPAARGINSLQAVHEGKRWRVISIVCRAENEAEKIPGNISPVGK